MFNRLPGAMLIERHAHECKLGHSCGRALCAQYLCHGPMSQAIQSGASRRPGWLLTA